METLNSTIALLNDWGRACCDFAGRMLLQSSVLIGVLLLADLCLRKRVSARFRYGMWLLVLVKLVLPPSLALPTGAAYWLGRYLPATPAVAEPSPIAGSLVLPPYAEPLGNIGMMPVGVVQTVTEPRILPLQWPGLMLLGWIAGVLLLLAVVLWQIVSMRRSLARSRPAGAQMAALLEECRAELGIAARVRIVLTNDLHSPAVCGFLRPVILLPAVLPPGLWLEGVRTILIHELTHIKRRDPWLSLMQTVLQVAYFWHPLAWAANAKLRYLRELAVDETVVARLQSRAQHYTDTLIDIAQMAFRKPAFSLRLIGIAESKRALERRITHMLNRQHISNRPAPGWIGLLAVLVIGAVLVPMGQAPLAAQAQQTVTQSVPALPEGIKELFPLSKDDILEKFGTPEHIFLGDHTYTLDNLPDEYFLCYEGLSFAMSNGAVGGVTLLSPAYVFGNGIRVGDSEEKVKEAFGPGYALNETESKDFLIYEALGINFEIHKQDRSVMEINLKSEYGDPAQMEAYARAAEFSAQLPPKIAQFSIDTADLNQVLATFGQPVKYVWGPKTLPPDQLPDRFIAVYPGDFQVFISNGRVVEVRHEHGSKYVFAGKLRVGSTLEEALAVLGTPEKTVEGQEIDWQNSRNVLFWDIGGGKGYGYYHRPDQKVRVWFWNGKVSAIYMTRSDYGQSRAQPDIPDDPEFARLLQERVARLNIDSANADQVRAIFGAPLKYVWGDKTFTVDALPDYYIMSYPCGFSVFMTGDQIREIRHSRNSPYVYAGTLRIGSTMEEAIALLGEPTETVTGQKNEFKDGVLYRGVDGEEGAGYYHRSDQKVRLFFAGGKVIAIYMTRSDYPVH